jgi:hypothetical protein
MRWHVEGSYNPSDRGQSKSGNHLVVDEPLRAGRLVREPGDPLCRPAKEFWGLTGGGREDRVVDCHMCIKRAIRMGLEFGARPSLDMGRSWSATLVVDAGRPRQIDLQSRWFRQPPVAPPSLPSEQQMLRAVQVMAPSVRTVRMLGSRPTGFNELAASVAVE